MSTSYKQLRFVTFICMLTLGQCLTSKFIDQKNDRVIIIDQDGTSDLECCMYGNCQCSNLSLALEHIQDNTEIRMQSVVSLHNAVVFENVSNVKITGDSNASVRCDHQGGLVGKNINYIVIQGITWDSCNGITMLSFTYVYIIESNFLNFVNFALTLYGLGSVNINDSVFSGNSSNVDLLAPYIAIHSSKFYGNSKSGSLVINTASISGTLLHGIKVTIERCEFNDILGHCVHCTGSASLLPNLLIVSSNFTDNVNTAVNVEHCNITLNNVTFYNNVNVDDGHINDGGAIRVYNGTVNLTGDVLFCYNRVGNNGGAIYLNHSVLYVSQGSVLFHNNTAKNGGAMYIGEGAKLHGEFETSIEFLGNNATSYGGAVYVDLHNINDATVSYQLSSYYYNLLTSSNCTCDFNNTADVGNCAYFNTAVTLGIENHYPNFIAFSCSIDTLNNSTVYINVTDINSADDTLKFWSHDLYLAITMDCFGDLTNPVNVSFQCCDSVHCNCIIDTENGPCVVTGMNTHIECVNSKTIICNISAPDFETIIPVTVQRFGHICDDIAHVYSDGICLPACSPSQYSSPQNCWPQDILPGYWYDNGFTQFVASCPIGHCKQYDLDDVVYTTTAIFPDRDVQCKGNWGGLACGECNYSAGFAIKYDTEKCISVDECLLHASVTYNILILFAVSFFYWILIISFIFVLLHFKFDITAGYAYGLCFYYSVLEQLVYDVPQSLETFNGCNVYINDDDCFYESARLKVLPFLSSIGILKLPLTGFIQLCFGKAKTIDHLMLGYIHPLIVTFLVVIIFILARNFVLVARTIGRYVNSKSICILLLLSYSSVTYNSMQLLKPMPVFKSDGSTRMQVYWSPTVKYFHDRHLWYGIIAILCELIIGIGIPLILIFERYLIHYCNINFTSMKPVIDQLKGCYKEKYRWFAAYYLLCRQVFYGVNNLLDYCNGFSETTIIIDTFFSNFTIMLTICIFIMLIHVWFKPYKSKVLNILDCFILLTLVGLLISVLGSNQMISIIFWFLPLLLLINYLGNGTKLKDVTIVCSCAVIFCATFVLAGCENVIGIFFLTSSSIVFIVYVFKNIFTRCHKTKPQYVAINEDRNDDDDENNDNSANGVTE